METVGTMTVRGNVDLNNDHDLIHKAIYDGYSGGFCPDRSRLIRAILYQRSVGLLSNDSFEGILMTARNRSKLPTIYSLFMVQVPEDIKCA